MNRTLIQGSAALLAALALTAACDTLDCGAGTHRDGDECKPDIKVVCGDGTEFRFGRCMALEPDAAVAPESDAGLTCGPGTRQEGNECVSEGGNDRDAALTPDARADAAAPPPDADPNAPDADPNAPDAMPDPDATPAPDAAPPPGCPEGREPGARPDGCVDAPPGTYCITALAIDFVTNCALPSDENLIAVLIDPIAIATGSTTEEATRGFAAIGPGGAVAIIGQAPAQQLAVVIDENPMAGGPDRWLRSVSGVSAEASIPNFTYEGVTLFASGQDAQARWNAALGEDDGFLEGNGFLIGRVLTIGEAGVAPLAGAEVVAASGDLTVCGDGETCMRFFDDDPRLVGFQAVGATRTGASGVFMLIRGGNVRLIQDLISVADPAGVYGPIPVGASAGSGFHTAFVPTQ